MIQIGRNMTDVDSSMLFGKRKLIIDRATKYCKDFRQLLELAGTTIIRLPPRSPNLNAYAERFAGSIKCNVSIVLPSSARHRCVAHFENMRHIITTSDIIKA